MKEGKLLGAGGGAGGSGKDGSDEEKSKLE
jgi:hypothetical protein